MISERPVNPRGRSQEQRKRALRIVGITASALMVVTVLGILFLIVRTELAHNEQRCKFERHSERSLGSVQVVEEQRQCLPELAERRYLVKRARESPFELARKRLPMSRFAERRYQWTLREDAAHKLVLRIDIDKELSSEFHEQDIRP